MRHMRLAMITATACVAAAAGTAHAQVTPIGEFVGESTETFENIMAPGPHDGPMPIFGGAATIDDEFTDPWITTILSDPDNNLFPYDGNFMGLTTTGRGIFDFDTPVRRFGGYFGMMTADTPAGSITFLDESGGTIDSMTFDVPYNQWTWMGWESDTPIARIEMSTGPNPGIPTVYDNMQMTTIPTPGALTVLAVGACARRRRRR